MERQTNSDRIEILAEGPGLEAARRYLGHLGLVDALEEPLPLSPEHDDEQWVVRGLE